MIRGFSFTPHKSLVFALISFLIFCIMTGLSGCGTPSPENQPPVICTPQSPNVNIYRVLPDSWAGAIFEMAFPTIPTPIPPAIPAPIQFNDQQILGARYAAFQYLLDETKRWSDTETITLSDQNKTRITLTFISPKLLQAVFLSDVLRDRFITSDFQTHLQNMLNGVAERDELLFLLTITTTSNNNITPTRHTIKIPINNMTLNNAENLIVLHSHDDHNLEQLIDTSAEPVFGYLAYPFAMLSGGQCKWVLDPKYNTNIVISVPFIEVDGVNSGGPYSWTIPYSSLINSIAPSNIPIPFLPTGFDPNLMSPLELPPSEINQNDYLQNFARYIWNQITPKND